ncbi:MAG TPA: Xaa-Pro peptidase family protein [Bryobacteraceae bacterium]
MNRRLFLATSFGGAIAAAQQTEVPASIRALKPMTDGIQPIGEDERKARIEKARRLMSDNKLGAILCEGGSTLFYYTGVRNTGGLWILPAKSEPVWVVPASEGDRVHGDVRAYAASEEPYAKAAQALKGVARLGVEERTRFAVFDALRKETPSMQFASADPVTVGCRVIKSPAEIALMQRANDITIAAYKAALPTMREGMTNRDLSANIGAAYRALGVNGGAMAIFGKYTAFPHGSVQPQALREGDMVLIDDGCSVDGYQSDITRTTVFGKPTARQRQIWDLERKAQDAALAAARVGAPCEAVDAAARKVITDAGFGPGYKVPGLPHRTGHGIGLDGHEWTNLVKGNKTPLRPGMCFSDEPTIAIYGEFGVRLEDCFYMTESGGRMFTKQSPSIEQPFG